MDIQVIKRKNALNLEIGDYASWLNNALSDANATILINEGTAVLTVRTNSITLKGNISPATGFVDGYIDTDGNVVPFGSNPGGGGANLTATRTSTTVTVLSDSGTDATIQAVDTTNAGVMTAADKTKLNGIANGATANAADASLRDRSTHTGTQPASSLQVATAVILGRNTAGSGGAEELSAATAKTILALQNVDNTSDATKNSATVTLTNKTINAANNTLTNIAQSSVTNLTTDLSGKAGVGDNNVFTVAQRGSITTLTYGATVTPDFNNNNFFSLTLTGNATLANPSNEVAGQSGSIFLVQDATGSRTLAYGTDWDFAGGTAPSLSTAANAVDRLDYLVRASGSIHANLVKDVK